MTTRCKLHEFQSGTCPQSIGVSIESEPGQSGMLHKHTNGWIGLREEKGVNDFDGWISPATTASKVSSLTPYEHDVYVALVDFPRQENHP